MRRCATGKMGQMLSAEIVLSASIFLFSLVAFLFAWDYLSASYLSEAADRQMELSLLGISDSAVLTPGYPSDWEAGALENASSFGFAHSPNILSSRKLSALQSLNGSQYDSVRERMGAGRFQLLLRVEDADGNLLFEFGRPIAAGNLSASSATAERLALLDGEPVVLKVQLWRTRGNVI